MAASLRRATVHDLCQMEDCSQRCIPERDAFLVQRFTVSVLCWPQLQWVAQGHDGRIVGYVTVDMDQREGIAYVRSIAVLPPHRRSGLATKLVNLAHSDMIRVYDAECAKVNVRQSNDVALKFFSNNRLGYTEHELMNLNHEEDDGEPFCVLRKQLRERQDVEDQPRPGAGDGGGNPGDEEVGPANHRPDDLGLEWLFI
ncbi:N-terminal acetyltransferase A complex catalytic subunit NAA10-like [Rhodamnia argentea]|uniref:N-terminal acetyltransferase A complex catalytic subunit NAA10-like n=1 Tax=Rhodamnia argentea TaxID=178133 RepID=A0A8B8PDW4_9MYRT|nr:N-terminal acetyltransferase A complex catalytic subunit NAA10-like [Rhodamnia argentea]XP_048135528.1 N-terminal acetyltransferase A complex catalytic subunit NAA10-like [Rhodamnia argentea]XP_048135529.1 N-terminal acetyltransferase A complex catalytic subunit NAA10-like [Rhodamnia argentea]